MDPEGLSTHTNEEGLVVAVYDDNDLNIYKHSNAKLSSWGDVYENHLTTDDAEIMGQSLHPMSFANQSKYNQNPSLGITASIYLMNGEETLSQLSIDKGYNYVK